MRHRVLDDKFLRQKKLALELERLFPDRFIPRYSMVMFHPEISYSEALRRGEVQQEILDVLDEGPQGSGHADANRAEPLVSARLSPLKTAKEL
jgi:kynurenine 3-monooxygenase